MPAKSLVILFGEANGAERKVIDAMFPTDPPPLLVTMNEEQSFNLKFTMELAASLVEDWIMMAHSCENIHVFGSLPLWIRSHLTEIDTNSKDSELTDDIPLYTWECESEFSGWIKTGHYVLERVG